MTKSSVETAKTWVAITAGAFAVISGIYGAVQAYSLLPIRLQMQTRELETIKSKFDTDHERLVRIESNIEWIKAVLDRNRMSKQDSAVAAQ